MNVSPNATRYKSCYRCLYWRHVVYALVLLIPAAVVGGYWIKGILG